MTENNIQNSAHIGIAAIIGGVCLGVIALIAIFSPDHMASAPWIIGGLSIMGILLGYFSSKKS